MFDTQDIKREDGALSSQPVTAPATVNESTDPLATAQNAWEGDQKQRFALLMSPETGLSTSHCSIAAGDSQEFDSLQTL